mgnify:CR=1 FL=1
MIMRGTALCLKARSHRDPEPSRGVWRWCGGRGGGAGMTGEGVSSMTAGQGRGVGAVWVQDGPARVDCGRGLCSRSCWRRVWASWRGSARRAVIRPRVLQSGAVVSGCCLYARSRRAGGLSDGVLACCRRRAARRIAGPLGRRALPGGISARRAQCVVQYRNVPADC